MGNITTKGGKLVLEGGVKVLDIAMSYNKVQPHPTLSCSLLFNFVGNGAIKKNKCLKVFFGEVIMKTLH